VKVCYVLSSLEHGGQYDTIANLVSYSIGRWEARLVYATSTGCDLPHGISVTYKASRSWIPTYDRALIKFFGESDVIHIKSGLPFLLPAFISRRPAVYTLHQPDPVWLFEGRRKLGRRLVRLLERPPILNFAKVFVSVSDWVRDWYLHQLGVESEVIPDSFNLLAYGLTVRSRPRWSDPKLVAVGWDGPNGRKRTHELFPYLPRFFARFPHSSLSVIGLTPGAQLFLREYAEHLGISSHVYLHGHLTFQEYLGALRGADVFVSTTIVEGFYRPIIEAFSTGLPAVVRDASDLVDPVCQSALMHLRRSQAGASYSSASSFLRGVETVLREYDEMSLRAVRYSEGFSNDRILPRYLKVYSRAASG
jgi:glycosyltransferase involved in cell wall biosynthesis